MSYLVLARKYRPRNFSEMVGQEHVVKALVNALTTQRLHHAYLFTGTRGVGKTTIARILAKSLNCQGEDGNGGITATPCGVCQACRDIDAGRFTDYTELDAASNRGVDEVQALLEQAVYKPVQGRFKVFMIDEVHMLTGHAFNAMLKTLEEPPDYLKFVLATTDPQKVPVTVLSRCLQFNLRPMAPATIGEHLQQVLHNEQVAVDGASLALLARAARGSMRDALSLADQAISFGAGRIEEASVRQMLGSVDNSYVLRLIDALARGDGKTVVEVCEVLRLNGLSAASTLEEMSSVLQRMAVLQVVPASDAADDADPQARELAQLAARLPADETQLLYSICLHGRAELGLAPDEYAALTMVLLRLLAFKPQSARPPAQTGAAEKKTLIDAPAVAPLLARAGTLAMPLPPSIPVFDLKNDINPAVALVASSLDATKTEALPVSASPRGQQLAVLDRPEQRLAQTRQDQASSATTPIAVALPAANIAAIEVRVQADPRADSRADAPSPEGAAALVPTEDGAFWHQMVQQLVATEAITAMARELALQSQLVGRDTDQWLLRVERESLNQAGSRERLASALRAAGHAVSLVVEVGRVSDSPARRNAAQAAERQLAAEKIIFDNPFVQSLMRDFAAKIVPGSIKQC